MATITLEYDAHNSFAASLIDAIKKSGVFKIEKPAKTKKCGLDMALEDIKEGRVCEIQDVTAYFKNLGANV